MIQIDPNINPSLKSLVLAVTGSDAGKFLQGQLTCDVAALQDGQSCLGAYCNIQGKVESLFNLHRLEQSYYLHMHPDLIQTTLKELQKYAVFSKVTLATVARAEPCAHANTHRDPAQEILAKIPAIYKQTINMFFAHDLNLHALGAVSFNKGCFRGQEIIARMQHRGNLKRSLYTFQMQDSEIAPGDTITTAENLLAGNVVRFCKQNDQVLGLAVITDSSANMQLFCNNNSIVNVI